MGREHACKQIGRCGGKAQDGDEAGALEQLALKLDWPAHAQLA